VTQLTVPKKPKFGPKVASQAWWIDRIKDKEGPKYLKYWTHYTDYQIGQFKALAEYDYFVLGEGIETEGAPDFGLELDYPVKLVGKPFWVEWSTLEFKEYKLWTWIQASIALERTLGERTITWFNYFSIESNQVQAKELLAPFRKESQKVFDTFLEQEYTSVYPNTSSISTIEFDPPRGSIYRDLYINRTIQDSRYIPITEDGLVIRKKFLKYYRELGVAVLLPTVKPATPGLSATTTSSASNPFSSSDSSSLSDALVDMLRPVSPLESTPKIREEDFSWICSWIRWHLRITSLLGSPGLPVCFLNLLQHFSIQCRFMSLSSLTANSPVRT